jgi:hypothetical protein
MKTIAVLYFLLWGLRIVAQTPSESWFDYNDQANGPAWIFSTDYGYITFSGLANIETYTKGCLITGLDPEGAVLWHKPLWTEDGTWPMNFGGAVIQAIDSGYYLLLNKIITEELNYPVVLRINENGDTLWSKALLDSALGSYKGFSIAQSPLGDLFMAGYVDLDPEPSVYNHKFTIMKADSEANYLWHLNSTVGNYPVPISILATSEDVIVGGRLWEGPLDQYWGITKDLIRKFDYEGTPQWTTKIHVPPAGAEAGIQAILPLNNGNYLYVTGRSQGTLSGNGETSNVFIQPTVGEIEGETGDTIAEYGFNIHGRYQQMFNLKRTADGGFVGVGTHRYVSEGELSGWPIGFMLKLDANLNEEWYRYYVPSVWEGMGRWSNLTDVVENENGTYTAVGLLYTNTGVGPLNGFIQDTYIVTVDSLGCIVEGCDVNVEEYEPEPGLMLYPNPTSDKINIQLPQLDSWTIYIYDSAGRIVLHDFKTQTKRITLDLTILQSGFYNVKAVNTVGKQMMSKISKQ